MTKELKFSLVILLVAITALLLRLPLERSLFDVFNQEFISRSIAASSLRLLLITGLLIFMLKKGFFPFNGWSPTFNFQNHLLILLTVAIILLLSYSSYQFYIEAKPIILTLFTVEQLLVGIFEELLFRGILFPLLIIHFATKKYPVFKAVILSSVLFGLVHLLAVIRNPDLVWNIINSTIFAIGVGFFLAALMLRTRNILAPAFIHFLIDFTNGASQLNEETSGTAQANPSLSTIVLTLIVVIVISLFLIGTGLFLYKQVNEQEWLQKASNIQI